MMCPACKYMMDSFDKECPRCQGKGLAAPHVVTPQTPVPQRGQTAALPGTTPNQSPGSGVTLLPPSSGLNSLQIVGGLLLGLGLLCAAYFFLFFDTSVAVPQTDFMGTTIGGGRVNNLGLMAQRQNGILMGVGMAIVGAVLFAVGHNQRSSVAASVPAPSATPQSSAAATTQAQVSTAPVSNTLVWSLAFAPILGIVVQALVAGILNISFNSLWFVTLLINIGLSMADEKQLKDARYDITKLGGGWLVPVYLFKRASLLRQSNNYAVVWSVAFVLSLGFSGVYALGADPVPADVPSMGSTTSEPDALDSSKVATAPTTPDGAVAAPTAPQSPTVAPPGTPGASTSPVQSEAAEEQNYVRIARQTLDEAGAILNGMEKTNLASITEARGDLQAVHHNYINQVTPAPLKYRGADALMNQTFNEANMGMRYLETATRHGHQSSYAQATKHFDNAANYSDRAFAILTGKEVTPASPVPSPGMPSDRQY